MHRSILRHPLLWISVAIIIVMPIIGLQIAAGVHAAPPPNDGTTTVPFSHQVHIQEAGVNCLFCHSEALRASQASIPSLEKCMMCHEFISMDSPEATAQVEQVKQAYQKGLRPQWPDVYRQPDFVRFSHRPHVAKGVACETCHGDVSNMTLVEQKVDMNMGFCLSCHRQHVADDGNKSSPTHMPRLLDCATCHK